MPLLFANCVPEVDFFLRKFASPWVVLWARKWGRALSTYYAMGRQAVVHGTPLPPGIFKKKPGPKCRDRVEQEGLMPGWREVASTWEVGGRTPPPTMVLTGKFLRDLKDQKNGQNVGDWACIICSFFQFIFFSHLPPPPWGKEISQVSQPMTFPKAPHPFVPATHRRSLTSSLARLQLPSADLYQIHGPAFSLRKVWPWQLSNLGCNLSFITGAGVSVFFFGVRHFSKKTEVDVLPGEVLSPRESNLTSTN